MYVMLIERLGVVGGGAIFLYINVVLLIVNRLCV